MEQGNLYNQINLSVAWSNYPQISYFRVPVYACPSDPKALIARNTGINGIFLYTTTYGFNFGTRFIYDPTTNLGGDGFTFSNSRLRFRRVTAIC